jgi:hypothetical protein
MSNMNNIIQIMDLISLIASIVSLVLAVGAIWLSIYFYNLSNQASNEIKTAAKDISSSVEKLEKLFDKLYADTFSMVKDTVSDMRKYIYDAPNQHTSISNDKQERIEKDIEKASSKVDEVIGLSDIDINSKEKKTIKKQIESILKETIINSMKANQKQKHSYEEEQKILDILELNKRITLKKLSEITNIPEGDLAIYYLFNMRKNNKITWDGHEDMLSSLSYITLNEDRE